MRKILGLTCTILLITLYSVSAQGGNGGGKGGGTKDTPIVPTGADTIYNAVTKTIYSIKEKDPTDTSLTIKYTVFFLNGEIQYYCTYEYAGKVLSKVNYFDAKNQMYAYGTYTKNSLSGFDYMHYASDKTLISETEYDADWISHQFTAYTSGQKLTYQVKNTMENGYITKERYFDENGTLYGEGIWSWVSSTEVTIYTYALKDGKKLKQSLTGDEYDRYEIFYKNNLKDSMKLYNGEINATNLVYTAKYAYNENGYMTEDKYLKDGALKTLGNYTFDKSTLKTTYTYKLAPDTLLWVTTYDYRYYYLKTDNYAKDGKIESVLTYDYDKYANITKITKKDLTGTILSYETYTYYDPYSILKEYAVFDNNNNKVAYITYDIYSNETIILGVKKKNNNFDGRYFTIQGDVFNQQVLFDVNGRVVGKSARHTLNSNVAAGVYLNKNSREKKVNILNK